MIQTANNNRIQTENNDDQIQNMIQNYYIGSTNQVSNSINGNINASNHIINNNIYQQLALVKPKRAVGKDITNLINIDAINLYSKKHGRNQSSIQFNRISILSNQEHNQQQQCSNIQQSQECIDLDKLGQLNQKVEEEQDELEDQDIENNENINIQLQPVIHQSQQLQQVSQPTYFNNIVKPQNNRSQVNKDHAAIQNQRYNEANDAKKNLPKTDNTQVISTRANTTITTNTQESMNTTNKENTPPQSERESEQNVPEYAHIIIDYMRQTEEQHICRKTYFEDFQTDINDKMRGILIDWLIDVHLKFKLLPETLFMTVNFIDRYLEKVKILRTKLQLVGVAALYIACKYEEVYGVPNIKDLVYVCDKAYTKEEILKMEGSIIEALNFNLITNSPLRFLEYYGNKVAKLDEKNYMLCKYLVEMSLLEYKMLQYKPSLIACAAIYLVHKIRKNVAPWSEEVMVASTKYKELDIRPCAKELCALLQSVDKRSTYKSLKKKFSQPKFLEVAKIRIEKKSSSTNNNNSNSNNHNCSGNHQQSTTSTNNTNGCNSNYNSNNNQNSNSSANILNTNSN